MKHIADQNQEKKLYFILSNKFILAYVSDTSDGSTDGYDTERSKKQADEIACLLAYLDRVTYLKVYFRPIWKHDNYV